MSRSPSGNRRQPPDLPEDVKNHARASSRFGQRLRSAWELSRPQSFESFLEEEPQELPTRWPERVQEAAAAIFYFGTFLAIVTAVFFRFALNRPVIWSIELPTYLFFWCFCLATPLSDWEDDQISFDLLADRMSGAWRLAGQIVGNILIVVPFVIVLPGTISYVLFQSGQLSSALPFSQAWGYAGILPFFVVAAALRGRLLVRQARELTRSLKGKRRK